MESSRYWQGVGVLMDRALMNEQVRSSLSLAHQARGKEDGGEIIYDGRLMSVDVYLALPTFIRRGISITV